MTIITSGPQVRRSMVYDTLAGKWIRELRDNDIFNLSQTSTNTAGASSVILTGVVGSGLEVYITNFYVGSSSVGSTGYMTIGTSTLLPFLTTGSVSASGFSVSNSKNAFLARATALSTITVIGTTQAGYVVNVTGNRYPTYANVETEA